MTWTRFNKLFWVQTSLTGPMFGPGIRFPLLVIRLLLVSLITIAIYNLEAKVRMKETEANPRICLAPGHLLMNIATSCLEKI